MQNFVTIDGHRFQLPDAIDLQKVEADFQSGKTFFLDLDDGGDLFVNPNCVGWAKIESSEPTFARVGR